MERKLDAGALLVAAAAGLLVVSLFLPWFGGERTSVTGWQVFELVDLVLLGTAVAAVASAFGRLDGRVLLGAAAVVFVVVVVQLLEPPLVAADTDREVGAWLALVAALGLLAGAALTAAQIAVTVDVRDRERRRRVPAVDERPRPSEPASVRVAEPAPRADAAVEDRFAPAAGGDDADATQVRAPDAGQDDADATQAFAPGDEPR